MRQIEMNIEKKLKREKNYIQIYEIKNKNG